MNKSNGECSVGFEQKTKKINLFTNVCSNNHMFHDMLKIWNTTPTTLKSKYPQKWSMHFRLNSTNTCMFQAISWDFDKFLTSSISQRVTFSTDLYLSSSLTTPPSPPPTTSTWIKWIAIINEISFFTVWISRKRPILGCMRNQTHHAHITDTSFMTSHCLQTHIQTGFSNPVESGAVLVWSGVKIFFWIHVLVVHF